MNRKFIAAILSAIMTVSCVSVSVSAEELQTASVMREYEVTAVRWNGKTELKAGKTYAITSNVTISKKVVIPSGTTLIVMKGAKLWVNGNGSLFIKGKLNVKSGGTLAVTGRLYQYKSKSLLCHGEMRFSKNANVTLNGKTTVYSTGSVTGTPKRLAVGDNADIICDGKNGCTKLDKYIDRTAMETRLDSFFTKAIQKSDIYGAIKAIMNAQYVSDLDKMLKQSAGVSFEDYCAVFGDEYKKALAESGIDPQQVKSVDVKLTELKAEKPEGDLAVIAEKYYNGAEKFYCAKCEVTIKVSDNTYTEVVEVSMAKLSGKWYLLGE